MARHAVNVEDVGDHEEMLLAGHRTRREALLSDLRTMMQQKMSTDIFALLAAVLRNRCGKMQEKRDTLWDQMMRTKDLTIFIYSMLGLATSIATATAFWYFGNRRHITLSEVNTNELVILWLLQFVLSASTVTTIVLIIQKYLWVLREKRKEWSGLDMYDLVQAKDNTQVKDQYRSSYSFFRSSLRWKLIFEVFVHFLHPMVWMNTEQTKAMYEAFQISIFLRLYLIINLIFSFSEQYKQRHEIVASNPDLQRSGFQLDVGSTLKMMLYDNPAVSVLSVLVLTLSCLGFIVFVVERSVEPIESNGFRNLQSSLWFAFATFATLGYGDLAPTTGFGRMASVLIGAIGISVTTIFGGVVTNLMVQSREQRYVSEYLTLRRARDETRETAARVIQMAFRYYKSSAHDIITPWTSTGHKSNVVYAAIQQFKTQRWEMRQSQSASSDPVTDASMNGVGLHLRQSVSLLKKHEKQLKNTDSNIASFVADIIKLLERNTQEKAQTRRIV